MNRRTDLRRGSGICLAAFIGALTSLTLAPTRAAAESGCGSVPTEISQRARRTVEFRSACMDSAGGKSAHIDAEKSIVVSDLRSNPANMYVFDKNGQNCVMKTAVTYGQGDAGDNKGATTCEHPTAKPVACNEPDKNYSPSGFHTTSAAKDCQPSKVVQDPQLSPCVHMIGLEGQGSLARGILVHGAQAPGNACSHGCSGVGTDVQAKLIETLEKGAVIDNWFGDDVKDCMGKKIEEVNGASCKVDGAGGAPAKGGGSQSAVPNH